MKLSKKFDRALVLVATCFLLVVFGCFITLGLKPTFAEGEERSVVTEDAKFVTIYDRGLKLTVRTTATTVAEALERAEVSINGGDKVEPALGSVIDVDNFYINIYRARPVIVKDGVNEKYLMTASYEALNIAKEAGVTIYDDDVMELVPNHNFLESGVAAIYKVTRNGGRTLTVEEEIPFDEEMVKDYNLAPGTSEVRQYGEVGTKKMAYNVLYIDGMETKRELISEEVVREPVVRIVAVGASQIEQRPLTVSMGRNRYTVTLADGRVVERQETYYDLPMSGVMRFCGSGDYSVRSDGAKVDADGYVLVAADLSRYPRCSIVATSLGPGRVYDTGAFVFTNPEQFDLATDWTNHDGR